MAAKKATAKKTPAKASPKTTGVSRTQAEQDYGTGARHDPPRWHELSTQSQASIEASYQEAMSNTRTREQTARDKGLKAKLPQDTINRLVDKTVTMDSAADQLVSRWDDMMGSDSRPAPAWYFGQNRVLTRIADRHNLPPERVMDASASMSPNNSPADEVQAAAGMADAVTNRRRITAVNDVYEPLSDKQKKAGKAPRLVMRAGDTRQITAMSPADMQAATAKSNNANVRVASDFAEGLKGFRSAGVNRKEGLATMAGNYNGVEEMESAKVPIYADSIKRSVPDSPLHHEYEARFWDQDAARNVRLARERDRQGGSSQPYRSAHDDELYNSARPKMGTVANGFQPAQSSRELRGVVDRVDNYGLMGKGAADDDIIHDHPVLGKRGRAVPDTWMAALQSEQEILDDEFASSPAKAAHSLTSSSSLTDLNTTFMGPKPSREAGGKPFSGTAAAGIASERVMQMAAERASEELSQTNLPPQMLQEMVWVHGRLSVRDSVDLGVESGRLGRGLANTRKSKLAAGNLEGEKEFRPQVGGRQMPDIEMPGSFHRGNDNPLDTDRIRVVENPTPLRGGQMLSGTSMNPAMQAFHERAAQQGPVSDAAKRKAILGAAKSHQAERADRGITAPSDSRQAIREMFTRD